MGSMAARLTSAYADIGELVVADLDLAAAEQVVAELTPSAATQLRAVQIDVTDAAALRALLADAQVVLNTTGPFYRLGTGVLQAAIVHWMQQISGTIDVVEAGQRVPRPPLVSVTIEYPGFGRGTAYTVGHPEPITLHETMFVHGKSANLMLLKRSSVAYLDFVRKDIDAGRLSHEDAAAEVTNQKTTRVARALIGALGRKGAGSLPGFFAFARGERDGQALRIGVHLNAMPVGMAGATSVPLALGLRQWLDGRLDATGVHPPESVIGVAPLLDGFALACNPPLAGMHELVTVNEAPAI